MIFASDQSAIRPLNTSIARMKLRLRAVFLARRLYATLINACAMKNSRIAVRMSCETAQRHCLSSWIWRSGRSLSQLRLAVPR